MPLEFDQYSTAKPLLSGYPAWINSELDQKRIASYQLYEEIYWNVPESFKLLQRGTDLDPIYIPSAKVIVETMHRYVANKLSVVVDPAFGDDNQQALALQVITDLLRRERFYSRFTANKRYGIMRGDWIWHLYADPAKPPGTRLSIFPVDPGSYFTIENPDNLDEVIGCHIVDQFIGDGEQNTERGKAYIKRLTYRKETGAGGPSPITVEEAVFEADAWGGPNMDEKRVRVLKPVMTLPSPIDALPTYHIQNFSEPGNIWGSSELRGFERIMAAIDQGISDEELALAMDGLGVYATNAGAPQDPDTGEDMPWNLGPARVVEVPAESFFNRISGIGSVTPMQDHLKYLHGQLEEASSTPPIAKGRISDVQVAESGVALMIELAPVLSIAEEKEQVVTDVMTNLFFDLPKWFIAYEGTIFNSLMEATRWVPIYGPKVPRNDQKEFENIIKMVTAKMIPNTVAWDMLRKLGWEIPDNTLMANGILADAESVAAVQADAMASRISGELGTQQEAIGNGAVG